MLEVSLLLVARDEAACIEAVLAQALAQDLARDRFEIVVVVDPASRDQTLGLAQAVLARGGGPCDRVILGRHPSLAAGWNEGIVAARADRIIRWDVHGDYPIDFLSRALAAARTHDAQVVGGPCQPTLPAGARGFWPRCILVAERSPLVAISAFRRPCSRVRSVATVARGLYHRCVFERIGLFRELPYACEDAELHARARAAGLRFVFDPAITSGHHVRTRVGELDRQKWRNGAAVGWIAMHNRAAARPLHWTPAMVVASVVAIAAAAPAWSLCVALAFHGLAAMGSLRFTRRDLDFTTALGAAAVIVRTHWIYGAATWWGVFTAWRSAALPLALPPRGRTRRGDRVAVARPATTISRNWPASRVTDSR